MYPIRGSFFFLICVGLQYASAQTTTVFNPCETGKLSGGNKIGVWSYYDIPGKLSLKIDYDKPELIYIESDTADFVIKDDQGKWIRTKVDVPTRFIGSYTILFDYYSNKFFSSVNNVTTAQEGIVALTFEVNQEGLAVNPVITQSTNDELSNHLLSIFNEAPNAWIVGSKNGKPITSRFQLSYGFCRKKSDCTNRTKPQIDLAKSLFESKIKIDLRTTVTISKSFQGYDYPKWSPDGSKIFFYSNLNDKNGVFIVDKDGANPYQIPYQVEINNPYWGLDSKSIYFDYKFLMLPNSIAKFLSDTKSIQTIDIDNAFEPIAHKNKLAYTIINQNNKKQIRIRQYKPPFSFEEPINLNGNIAAVSWNLDGTKLIIQKIDEDYRSLYVYNTTDQSVNILPILKSQFCGWSPDYSKVLVSQFEFKDQLFVIDLKSNTATPITKKSDSIHDVQWLANGIISYMQYTNLFIMNSDGSSSKKILSNIFSPSWNASGTQVAYVDVKKKDLRVFDLNTEEIKVIHSLKTID
jgi:Tol biopolymer transport system component